MKDYSVLLTCGESTMIVIHDAFDKGYKQGYKDGKADTSFTDTEEAEKKAYNRGLSDVWDAVRKIIEPADDGGYSFNALHTMFGESSIRSILKHNTAIEAIDKIKAYEDKQKQDTEIKVGDEVVFEDAHVVITYISPSNEWNGFLLNDCERGKRGHGYTLMKGFNGWEKTDRHFPQIVELLAEMRDAENDK